MLRLRINSIHGLRAEDAPLESLGGITVTLFQETCGTWHGSQTCENIAGATVTHVARFDAHPALTTDNSDSCTQCSDIEITDPQHVALVRLLQNALLLLAITKGLTVLRDTASMAWSGLVELREKIAGIDLLLGKLGAGWPAFTQTRDALILQAEKLEKAIDRDAGSDRDLVEGMCLWGLPQSETWPHEFVHGKVAQYWLHGERSMERARFFLNDAIHQAVRGDLWFDEPISGKLSAEDVDDIYALREQDAHDCLTACYDAWYAKACQHADMAGTCVMAVNIGSQVTTYNSELRLLAIVIQRWGVVVAGNMGRGICVVPAGIAQAFARSKWTSIASSQQDVTNMALWETALSLWEPESAAAHDGMASIDTALAAASAVLAPVR